MADTRTLESEDDLRAAIQGADFVVCRLDAAQSNLTFKLNLRFMRSCGVSTAFRTDSRKP